MKCWEAAIQVLKETGNPAVMWGDLYLLYLISERMGWDWQHGKSERKVLNALTANPGELMPVKTVTGKNRVVRKFKLPT